MVKESRLLTGEEIAKALKRPLDRIYPIPAQIIAQAQDTKSVKARDKEWVEWIEKFATKITEKGAEVLLLGDIVISREALATLKRGNS